ncbi:HD-GYP domain-containing protein [Marinomonas dokdonensis]|uniref:HD-GYP domain-containing protein n=1 Tax=Marinomonas dokdonensis TaxID=328224 RepID=UPI0040558A2E
MSAFNIESCFGADITVGYFDIEEILDVFGIKTEVFKSTRLKSLIKQHGRKDRIVTIVMRQVALDYLKPDLEAKFLPYDVHFNDDLLLSSKRERLYDAQERFLLLCYSIANGKPVRSLKKLHKGLSSKEWREKHQRNVSLYKYFRQELNDHTREYILSYKARASGEQPVEKKAPVSEPVTQPVEKKAEPQESLARKLPTTDKHRKTTLEEELVTAQKLFATGGGLLAEQVSKFKRGEAIDLEALKGFARHLIDSYQRNNFALMLMRQANDIKDYLPRHILGMATLSVPFALGLKLTTDKIENIVLGCLVFDLGRFRLPQAVVSKPEALNSSEVELFQNHIRFGEQVLKKCPDLPNSVYQMLTDHHERVDASGYPQGKSAQEISNYGKMAAIIDAFDSITSVQPHRSASGPITARKRMLEDSGRAFEPNFLAVFLNSIGSCPVGTCVELSNGRLGFVLTLDKKLQPALVRQVYSLRNKSFIPSVDLELSKSLSQDSDISIIREVTPQKYGLKLSNCL